ncbi:unnamed protein product [Peniophora sp. CBMAI 1063]|nr:unnamed protein product [Peniophora sp. CBMAI 1063]
MSVSPALTVYIVRHGETDANLNKIIQGHLDVPLNDTGRSQAHLLSQSLRDVPFTRAWSSDLQRASATAEEVLKEHPTVKLTKDVALRERFLGQWQGKSVAERHAASKADADGRSIEPPSKLRARLMEWWSNNITTYATQSTNEHVLVLSHGYAISILFQSLIKEGVIACAPVFIRAALGD